MSGMTSLSTFNTEREGKVMGEYFATRYASPVAEVIGMLSDPMEGYVVEDAGDVESPVGFMSLVFIGDQVDLGMGDDPDGWFAGMVRGLVEEHGVTASDVAGFHIVTTDDQGFVGVESFGSADEARGEFDRRVELWSDWEYGVDEWLYDRDTAEPIRPATRAEVTASSSTGVGAIEVDGRVVYAQVPGPCG
jgi:hypothetical protein